MAALTSLQFTTKLRRTLSRFRIPTLYMSIFRILINAEPLESQVVEVVEICTPHAVAIWGKLLELGERARIFDDWGPALFGLFLVQQRFEN